MRKCFSIKTILSLLLVAGFGYLTMQVYQRIYLPACERRLEAEARTAALREEVQALTLHIAELDRNNHALEAEEPLAVEEAIRQELGWGQEDEYALIATP